MNEIVGAIEKARNGLITCFKNKSCDGCVYEAELKQIINVTADDDWHCPVLDDILNILKDQEQDIKHLQCALKILNGEGITVRQ